MFFTRDSEIQSLQQEIANLKTMVGVLSGRMEIEQGRVDALADKANAGTLTEIEQSEYDQYLAAFHFVTILQARARRFIQS